jgi:hypothetical protein
VQHRASLSSVLGDASTTRRPPPRLVTHAVTSRSAVIIDPRSSA